MKRITRKGVPAGRERLRALAGGVLFAALAATASAQSAETVSVAGIRIVPAAAESRPTYGTVSAVLVSIAATDCTPVLGATAVSDYDGYVHPGAGTLFDCPMDLPAGARILRAEALTHDASDAGSLTVIPAYCPIGPPGTGCIGSFPGVSTGTAASPSEGKVTSDVSSLGYVVDKTANLYIVRVAISTTTGDVKFRQVDVSYQLQVSTPAPGTQTFGDVPPGSLYYKGIEALAASGITGGCGGGNFCPSQNITRGEIATLFARALGLHFPN